MSTQVLLDCHQRGLVHGDLKPDNIRLSKDRTVVKLVDFGSSSIRGGEPPLPNLRGVDETCSADGVSTSLHKA
jgi:serine/threonine protein kinase